MAWKWKLKRMKRMAWKWKQKNEPMKQACRPLTEDTILAKSEISLI
jgi:hypothetical protein